jgi:hypothetical protein
MIEYTTQVAKSLAESRALSSSLAHPPLATASESALNSVATSAAYAASVADSKATAGVGGGALSSLSDVQIVGVTDGELLAYDAGIGKWVNGAVIALDGPF